MEIVFLILILIIVWNWEKVKQIFSKLVELIKLWYNDTHNYYTNKSLNKEAKEIKSELNKTILKESQKSYNELMEYCDNKYNYQLTVLKKDFDNRTKKLVDNLEKYKEELNDSDKHIIEIIQKAYEYKPKRKKKE